MGLAIKDYSDTTYVTGMRAYAALAVVLIHAGGAGLRSLGLFGNLLVDMGRGGVYAFFVISGFSVAASYRQAGGFGRYLFLRFFRLAPLYYAWLLIFAFCFQREGYRAQSFGLLGWGLDLGLHLSFLHGFVLASANSIIGVEWSLSVEMFWYLLLPAMLWMVERGRGLALFILGALAYAAIHVACDYGQRSDPSLKYVLLWHPFAFALPFAMGVWAHDLRAKTDKSERANGSRLALFLLGLFLAASVWHQGFVLDLVLIISLVTFLLLVYGSSNEALCRALFMPRLVLSLGTLSYGIYLAHQLVVRLWGDGPVRGPLVDLGRFIVVTLFATTLSYLMYEWIERPSQRWSKRFLAL